VGFVDIFDERSERDELELSPNATSLEFLQACYRNSALPLSTRMRAAVAALQFEHPKLSAAAVVHDDGTFAQRLEKALLRSALANGGGANVINGEGSGPKVIEHEAGSGLRRI
jgi:hypothetical protein